MTLAVLAVLVCGLASGAAQPAAQAPGPGDIQVLKVQGNVYMLVGAGGNITLQIGEDGVLMVDAGTASQRVGYLSASQFSREYSRFFGSAPTRDIARLRQETRLWA